GGRWTKARRGGVTGAVHRSGLPVPGHEDAGRRGPVRLRLRVAPRRGRRHEGPMPGPPGLDARPKIHLVRASSLDSRESNPGHQKIGSWARAIWALIESM